MKDFSDTYSEPEGRRVAWWQNFGYHYQAAIYCELVRQTFSLIAASKETVPDVAYIKFDNEYLRTNIEQYGYHHSNISGDLEILFKIKIKENE